MNKPKFFVTPGYGEYMLNNLHYSQAVKIDNQVEISGRKHRRHSNFYIGIHGYDWIKSLHFFAEQTAQLMSLSPHKLPYYQRGRRAEKLINSTFTP